MTQKKYNSSFEEMIANRPPWDDEFYQDSIFSTIIMKLGGSTFLDRVNDADCFEPVTLKKGIYGARIKIPSYGRKYFINFEVFQISKDRKHSIYIDGKLVLTDIPRDELEQVALKAGWEAYEKTKPLV